MSTQLSLRTLSGLVLTLSLVASAALATPACAGAVEVGQPAPDFKLASTFGNDISLGDFRGKKWVLLEFYGADFAPA